MKPGGKVIIGRLEHPYGLHGWIKVTSFSNPIDNILSYQIWQTQHNHQWQTKKLQAGKLHISFIVAKLEGINNPETAKAYTNHLIAVARQTLPHLKGGDYYWTDLIGLKIINTQGIQLGIIHSLLETGSNDVLVVKSKERERLIPYMSKVIQSVNLGRKIIVVKWDADF